ncbi:hypothetical protein DFR57_104248 [Saliterribacillus persicus]|uniref:Uncharacterized protein n=1 Tax=Saliterribacillus persicus TaxID=930114 RepID=A0A368XYT1_9BACI|nr:hypothetical protein DFR57_104248 [Saliterribacillus persicus]
MKTARIYVQTDHLSAWTIIVTNLSIFMEFVIKLSITPYAKRRPKWIKKSFPLIKKTG